MEFLSDLAAEKLGYADVFINPGDIGYVGGDGGGDESQPPAFPYAFTPVVQSQAQESSPSLSSGDTAELTGLRRRPDLNGRRVEITGEAVGKDGAPRFTVQLLDSSSGAGCIKVKAANLKPFKPEGLDTLVDALNALAAPEDRRDWAGGLPQHVLKKVAWKYIELNDRDVASHVKKIHPFPAQKDPGGMEYMIDMVKEQRRVQGHCLLPLAMVCKKWREMQLTVGKMCTRVATFIILSGRPELVAWALKNGAPEEHPNGRLLLCDVAVQQGRLELVKWLWKEGFSMMDPQLMGHAALSGNLSLVQWLKRKGCKWDSRTCADAVQYGHVHVLRWVRENGCPWDAETRDVAAKELGYTDELGNGGAHGRAEPAPGDKGELVGLRSRPDLNGRRVEVTGRTVGKDGGVRCAPDMRLPRQEERRTDRKQQVAGAAPRRREEELGRTRHRGEDEGEGRQPQARGPAPASPRGAHGGRGGRDQQRHALCDPGWWSEPRPVRGDRRVQVRSAAARR